MRICFLHVKGLGMESSFLFIGLVAPWFTQSPGRKCQHQAKQACKEKSHAPASHIRTSYSTSNHKATQNADQLTHTPPAHDKRAPFAMKIIAHQSCTSGEIASLTNT